MKKIVIFIFAMTLIVSCGRVTVPITNSHTSPAVPLAYTAWSQWGWDICCDPNLIQWEADTKASIRAGGGTYVRTESQERLPCADCWTEHRYRMAYLPGVPPPLK